MNSANQALTSSERFDKGWGKEIDGVLQQRAIVSAMAALNAFATFGSVLQSAGSPCAGQA